MFEDALGLWPRGSTRGRGIHQAGLALACAHGGEPERAASEGLKALDIAHSTRSRIVMRRLEQLDHQLAIYDVPAAADFREAIATL